MEKIFWTYILPAANGFRDGKTVFCLYDGERPERDLVCGHDLGLVQRVSQHREGTFGGFTKKYDVRMLVWYEAHENAESAIQRERQIKEWKRDWKKNLIERENPRWEDLFESICK